MKKNKDEVIVFKVKKPDIIEYDSHSVVLINPDEPTWIKTSATGKWIFDLVMEKGTIEKNELISKVLAQYSLPRNVIKKIVDEFINKLADYHFIAIGGQSQIAHITQNNVRRSNDELPNIGLTSLWFSVTSECNLNCKHCFVNKSYPRRSIPEERALYVLKQAAKLHVKRLYLSGGEPLLHPKIYEIVASAKAMADWDIIFTTNGFTDNLDLIERISKHIDCFQFSIDGADEITHDSIRGAGSFRRVVNILRYLFKINSKVRTVLSFTPLPNNVHQIPDLYKLALSLNMDAIYITKPKKPGTYIPSISQQIKEFLSIEFMKKVIDGYDLLVNEFLKQRRGLKSIVQATKLAIVDASFDPCCNLLLPGKRACCGAGGNQLYINEDGDCYPCAALVRPEHLLGNVFQDEMERIYHEEAVLKFRQSIHIDHITECSECSFRYFCAGDCRAIAERSDQRSPYCELIKERYHRFLKQLAPNY